MGKFRKQQSVKKAGYFGLNSITFHIFLKTVMRKAAAYGKNLCDGLECHSEKQAAACRKVEGADVGKG